MGLKVQQILPIFTAGNGLLRLVFILFFSNFLLLLGKRLQQLVGLLGRELSGSMLWLLT